MLRVVGSSKLTRLGLLVIQCITIHRQKQWAVMTINATITLPSLSLCLYSKTHANRAHFECISVFPALKQSQGREDEMVGVEGAHSAG